MTTNCKCFADRLNYTKSLTIGQGHGGDNFDMVWENEIYEDGSVMLNLKYSFQNPGKRKTYRKVKMITRYCPFCGHDNRPGKN